MTATRPDILLQDQTNEDVFSAHPELKGARVHDLVAKIAHVTLKDTIRVMSAINAIAEFADCSGDTIVRVPGSKERATPVESAKCDLAYARMVEHYESGGVDIVAAIGTR
jgi:hypothetical protein